MRYTYRYRSKSVTSCVKGITKKSALVTLTGCSNLDRIGIEGQRSIGGRQSSSDEPPGGVQDESHHNENGHKGAGPGLRDLPTAIVS
jgi:hypothetical protein